MENETIVDWKAIDDMINNKTISRTLDENTEVVLEENKNRGEIE